MKDASSAIQSEDPFVSRRGDRGRPAQHPLILMVALRGGHDQTVGLGLERWGLRREVAFGFLVMLDAGSVEHQ